MGVCTCAGGREHTNAWIGDGRAVGRLHFDPYENLMAQARPRQ